MTYQLKWGVSLIDFTPKLSTANQVASRRGPELGPRRRTGRYARRRTFARRLGINDDLVPLLLDERLLPARARTRW